MAYHDAPIKLVLSRTKLLKNSFFLPHRIAAASVSFIMMRRDVWMKLFAPATPKGTASSASARFDQLNPARRVPAHLPRYSSALDVLVSRQAIE
jgi:hypothetical protein